MIKKILLVFGIFILLVLLANNIIAPTPKTPWYAVEPWEEEVCSKWGGTEFAGQEAVTSGRNFAWSTMTATAQGKKFKTPENYYLYEVGWYLDSFGQLTDYELVMINPAKADLRYLVDSGSLEPESGTIGYEIYNLTSDYTHLKLTYTGGSITTPIITVR